MSEKGVGEKGEGKREKVEAHRCRCFGCMSASPIVGQQQSRPAITVTSLGCLLLSVRMPLFGTTEGHNPRRVTTRRFQ